MPSHASFGVFTSSNAVGKAVSKEDSRRFQFMTTNGSEFTQKHVSAADRESFFDLQNAGKTNGNKYLDRQVPFAEMTGRESCRYHKDFSKRPPLDYEANKFLRESFGPTRSGNTIVLAKEGKPLDFDWSLFKTSEHQRQMRWRSSSELRFTKPMKVWPDKPDTFLRVLNGRNNKLLETKSHEHDTINEFAIAVPDGKKASYPPNAPDDSLRPPGYHFGKQCVTLYKQAEVHAAERLVADQAIRPTWAGGKRSEGLRHRSASQPSLRT